MAGKITDYTPLTTLSDGDLSDWSNFDEVSAYDSRSVSWADLKTNIQNQITFDNIYTQDGTLTGNRIVSMGVNDLTFGSTGDSNLLKFETTNDRIGIGTGTPTEKLDVVGNVQLDGFLYVNKNNGGVNLGGNTAFSKQLVMQSDWTYNHGNFTIKNNGIDVDFRNVSNGQFTWRNGGAISMVYDSNERLGIGTGTPTEKLHVNGRQFISNQSAPSTPTGGGIVYVEAGALKYIGSSGTITILGVA